MLLHTMFAFIFLSVTAIAGLFACLESPSPPFFISLLALLSISSPSLAPPSLGTLRLCYIRRYTISHHGADEYVYIYTGGNNAYMP